MVTPVVCPDNMPVYHLYVIRAPRRDELQGWLKSQGVFAGVHYPVPAHLQKAMGGLGHGPGDLPVTERITGEILSLPMYAELDDTEIRFVTESIHAFWEARH